MKIVLRQNFATMLSLRQLENVAIVNALQLEAARATPALVYDVMPSLKSLNLSIAVL